MVRQTLAEPAGPPPRKQGSRPAPATGPIQNVLDKLADKPLTIWEIWTTVTDEHDSDASYAAIRDYIRARRLAGQLETRTVMGRNRWDTADLPERGHLLAAGGSPSS
jgi:hypothetical protein